MTVSRYSFSEHCADWPERFAAEAAIWRELLGAMLVDVHHVGSTSVPGLAAKPVIDLLPVVKSIEEVEEATSRIEAAGYRAWGEYGLPGRRFFTKDAEGERTHNIHIYGEGNVEIVRHLAFCAYLRQDDLLRAEYEALKREGYRLFPADITGYCAHKNDWIQRIEPLAVAWYREQQGQVT